MKCDNCISIKWHSRHKRFENNIDISEYGYYRGIKFCDQCGRSFEETKDCPVEKCEGIMTQYWIEGLDYYNCTHCDSFGWECFCDDDFSCVLCDNVFENENNVFKKGERKR